MADAPDVSLTVLNPNNEPAIFVGIQTELNVTLTNNSDAIILTTGSPSSSLKIFMPTFFTTDELKNMRIVLNGWDYVLDVDDSLLLTYTGPSPANWSQGQKISFKITGVQTSAQPTADSVQIIFQNMGGNVPRQVQEPLSLSNPPRPFASEISACTFRSG